MREIISALQNAMGMCHLKIIGARQAYVHHFKTLKNRFYSCNANIFF